MLIIFEGCWGLKIAECPCDVHFVEWVEDNGIRGKSIFHFGSGGHHYVGIRCAEPALDNAVMSITASPQEYEAWMQLAKERPGMTRSYVCYFGGRTDKPEQGDRRWLAISRHPLRDRITFLDMLESVALSVKVNCRCPTPLKAEAGLTSPTEPSTAPTAVATMDLFRAMKSLPSVFLVTTGKKHR
jgi:hypothetical protein